MYSSKAILSHGIRQTPWRMNPMRPLANRLDELGVPWVMPDLGYKLVPITNRRAVRAVAEICVTGDTLVGFSSGCYANAMALRDKRILANNVVNVSAALDRRWEYPSHVKVWNFYCPDDRVLTMGTAWASFANWMPWRIIKGADGEHGWGDAGRYGLETPAVNIRLPWRTGHKWYKDPEAVNLVAQVVKATMT